MYKNTNQNDREHIPYPVRINRYLSLIGVCSRRKADELIARGEVHINNKTARLGTMVNDGDNVTLGKSVRALQKNYNYFLYHKPIGVVSHNPQNGELSAQEDANLPKDFAPIGRLDKASSGLMLLTNDGRIVDKMLNPKHEHSKEYYVTLDKTIKNMHIKVLSYGVDIEGYKTKPAKVKKLSDKKIHITLTEGKKHQIRRMLAALGYQVTILRRTAIMHLKLGKLEKGDVYKLSKQEIKTLLGKLQIHDDRRSSNTKRKKANKKIII